MLKIEYTLKLFRPVKILSFAMRRHPVSTPRSRLGFVLRAELNTALMKCDISL